MTKTLRHEKLKKNLGNSRSLKEAMVKSDYTESYAEAGQIKQTKGYQEVIAPVLRRYEREEQRILDAMNNKDLNEEQYKTLTDATDKVRKQIQLLSGKATERTEQTFNDEQYRNIIKREAEKLNDKESN